MMTIDDWLNDTTEQFSRANIPTARLDAELLLCHMLGVDRTWLIAHGEDSVARTALSHKDGVHPGGMKEYGDKLVLRRLKREPIAYLLGKKEFYGRNFIVNRDVLIPRPETEVLVDLAKKHVLTGNILDVGCGSGALGLTLWHELQDVTVTLSDISEKALDVAMKNAKKLKVKNATFIKSDLMEQWTKREKPETYDAIIANLPYVDKDWERSPETAHEPRLALFAQDGGLELIKELLDQAPYYLNDGGYLLLESDPEQQNEIIHYCTDTFRQKDRLGYGLVLQKL